MSTPASPRLAGKLALVTGASAGIGRATALALAREGAEVIATGRRASELQALQEECGAFGGKVRPVAGDMADHAFIGQLATQSAEADIFINNAGVLTYAPFLELTDRQNEEMFQVNVLAGIRICQLIARSMAERKRGHIVIMSSLAARNIRPYAAVYGATKHAMSGIAKGLRIELGPAGLKVTEVAPGMVDTDIRSGSTHAAVQKSLASRGYAPLSADDVAQAVLYAVTTSTNCCPDLIELRPTYS
jgi:NADP-dependent 3-hydroxy acid dehydrogenase YdfG